MKRLSALIILLLIYTSPAAEDKTPYKFVFGGNSYYGDRNASITWLAERYDAGFAGLADWPGMHDSIYDTAVVMGKDFWCGPYASSQEINLYDRFNPGAQYNERLQNVGDNWLYIYAKEYLDSIGVSVESLVVHVDDDYLAMTQYGDGYRDYSLSGLPYHKKRFTYQYWNNTPSDTMFYPAGYVWLANGYNRNAREAIAYAYRRHLIEDSAAYGPGDHHWTTYFMDNQYRGGYAPRLYSYYNLYSSMGGPTASLDWVEQPGIGNDVSANLDYYDGSTLLIDSTIKAVLDSTCDANSINRIYGFANVDKFSAEHLGVQVRYTNVTLENPVDYDKAWPNGWKNWYAMADTMANHPERYINWLFLGDFLCSSDPGDWKYDSSRIYLTHYAFFLQVRDTNAFCGPARFNDKNRWRSIYEVDFGEPEGPAYEVGSVGSNYDKIAVMRRDYDAGTVAVLLRTSHGSADWVRDSVAVNMHQLYREIDVYGDTSATSDSVFYMKPYMGKILITSDSCAIPPTVPVPSSPAPGSSVGTSPILCVANSIDSKCHGVVAYQFEVSEDINFGSSVHLSGWIAEGPSSTCYIVSPALEKGRRYYWRSRATNGVISSRWSNPSNFTTPNIAPPRPIAVSPANLDTIDVLRPTLSVNNLTDPDGTPVTLYFEVSEYSNFSVLAVQSGGIIDSSGSVSWQTGIPLSNNSLYYWRARSFDGVAYGQWMTTRSFYIEASISDVSIRGDINANGVVYEIADAIVFSNYFVSGLSAFGDHVEASKNASDANADGLTLSVADLSYLVRVITGDALPYPKITDVIHEAVVWVNNENSSFTLGINSPVDIGAGYFIFENSDYDIAEPFLGDDVAHMSLKHGLDGDRIKILVYSFEKGRSIVSGSNDILSIPIDGFGSFRLEYVELADYFGNPIKANFNKSSTLPQTYSLSQNYPNPFNATTTISYELPRDAYVRLSIYNIVGQQVIALVDGQKTAGIHKVHWNGKDNGGNDVASGIYIYQLATPEIKSERKMILMK